jgi:hypothetical protein
VESRLPEDIVQFVRTYIRSLDQLEALLLVAALPGREWSAAAIDVVIRSTPENVQRWLDEFVRAGILAAALEPGLYVYQPVNEQLRGAVAALGASYKMSRHKIVELIYAPPSAIQSFSDAFRFKKRE